MAKVKGFNEGLKVFRGIKMRVISNLLEDTCRDLIEDALENKEYTGFTGNTQTSYSCGIYLNGELRRIVSAGDKMSKPVRKKVAKDEVAYLANPYEGPARTITGRAYTNDLSGQETSEKFLAEYKGLPKEGFAIVMTTGTEYSVFIEQIMDLTVLGSTYQRAREILKQNVKPIK